MITIFIIEALWAICPGVLCVLFVVEPRARPSAGVAGAREGNPIRPDPGFGFAFRRHPSAPFPKAIAALAIITLCGGASRLSPLGACSWTLGPLQCCYPQGFGNPNCCVRAISRGGQCHPITKVCLHVPPCGGHRPSQMHPFWRCPG